MLRPSARPQSESLATLASGRPVSAIESSTPTAQIQAPPQGLFATLGKIGPGLILSANIVGAGELIVTTKLGAEVGFQLLWFIVFGCLVKVFLQIELGRHTLLHGRTTLEALNGLPGPRLKVSWVVWVWLAMFVATFFQVAGIVGGIASVFQAGGIGQNWPTWLWAALITGSCAALLSIGRYVFIERFATVLVALFTLFTILAVVGLAWTPYRLQAEPLLDGLRFHLPSSFATAFAAFGVIGVGASELIYYPYWCLEKGYARFTGPNDGSAAWSERARGWLRVLQIDAWVSFAFYTGATLAFYLLGAAVLHAKGLEVSDQDLIVTLSHMYEESFGAAGFWIFLGGALVVLFSTVFIATASNGRLFADVFRLFGLKKTKTEEERVRLARVSAISLPLIYFVAYITVGAPVTLILAGALAQALMLPFLAFSGIYYLYTKTPHGLRPGRLSTALLWLSAFLIATAGLYQLLSHLNH